MIANVSALLCKVSRKLPGGPQWWSPTPWTSVISPYLTSAFGFSYLTRFAMLPVTLAESTSPGHCCVGCPCIRHLYPKLHDATTTCHQCTKVSHCPGKVLPLTPLTPFSISSFIHAAVTHCCLSVPGIVLGAGDTWVQQADTMPASKDFIFEEEWELINE